MLARIAAGIWAPKYIESEFTSSASVDHRRVRFARSEGLMARCNTSAMSPASSNTPRARSSSVLVPVVMSLGGWWIDSHLGTAPWFAVVGAVLGLVGSDLQAPCGVSGGHGSPRGHCALGHEERTDLQIERACGVTHGPTRVVTDSSGNALMTRLEGRSPAMEIASDMARGPSGCIPLVVAFGAFWGTAGVLSAGYALAVVIVNFLLAGWLLGVCGRISFAAMAGAAMFGYLIRLGIITPRSSPFVTRRGSKGAARRDARS